MNTSSKNFGKIPIQSFPQKNFWKGIVLALLLSLLCAWAALGQTTKPVGPMVWYQPMGSMPKWYDRGIRVFFGYENEGVATAAQLDAWCKTAGDLGCDYILTDGEEAHWNDKHCLGVFCKPDEPDAKGVTTDQYKAVKIAYRAKTPKDRYISLNGGAVRANSDTVVAAYCADAEKIMFFDYPYNYGAGPGGVIQIGQTVEKLKRCAPGKPVIFWGECGDQGISKQSWVKDTPLAKLMHGPDGDEMAFEYGVAIAHGADGVGHFATVINEGFGGFDGSIPETQRTMKAVNALFLPAVPTERIVYLPATRPATQPAYQNAYINVHIRTYNGTDWRVVVP